MGPSDKEPLARSLTELVDLLLKLNSKIREKISPRPKGETKGAKNTEMVIIILNNSSGAPTKAPRPQKTRLSEMTGSKNSAGILKGEAAVRSPIKKPSPSPVPAFLPHVPSSGPSDSISRP
jgi:hypothetical protein